MSVQSVVIAFPAVCFSHGVTNYLCKAITGAALWAVYLCMGLCHCHSHSHVGFLLIFNSHIPICPSPPPPNVPPSSAMNSFSRFSLPVTSPSPLHPSHFLSVCLSHRFTQNAGGVFVGVETLHASGGGHKFLSACSQPEGTGARWSARQHEVAEGGCISSHPTSRGMQMSLLFSLSPARNVRACFLRILK